MKLAPRFCPLRRPGVPQLRLPRFPARSNQLIPRKGSDTAILALVSSNAGVTPEETKGRRESAQKADLATLVTWLKPDAVG